jgi:outer membrane receptor protein involved in Fe transport
MSLPRPRALRAWYAAAVAAFFVLAPAARAQTGTVTGVVVDEATGESLIGVNVQAFEDGAEAMAGGGATDLDGRYRIAALAPGRYDLVFSYVGYSGQRVTGVEVADGQTAALDVALTEEAVEVGEAVVEAALIRSSDAALLADRRRAAAVSDAISAETIARSGASTAGDAMQKVTGASILDGRYLVMRGLQGRYLNVQLNGAVLPSADPDRNAVPLDLFPSGLLDNIVTAKTFTPDQPGDFTGGAVNLATRDFPDELSATVSVSSGFNTNTDPGSEYLVVPGARLGLLGGADGSVELPALAEGELPSAQAARNDDAVAAELEAVSEAFGATMVPGTASAPVNQSLSVSVGNRFEVAGRPFGYIGGLNWSRGYAGRTGVALGDFLAVVDGGTDAVKGLQARKLADPADGFGGQVGSEEVLLGGLAHFSFRPSERSELGLNLLYNRNALSEAVYREVQYLLTSLSTDGVVEERSLLYQVRTLGSAQLRGEHAFGGAGLARLEWKLSGFRTTQEEPDYRLFYSSYVPTADGGRDYGIVPAAYTEPRRYFRDLGENAYTASADLGFPLAFLGTGTRVKVGGLGLYKDRHYDERSFLVRAGEADYEGDPEAFFQPENVGVLGQNEFGQNLLGNYVADNTDPLADYDGEQTTGAGYAMLDAGLTGRLRVIAGARVEANRTTVRPVNATSAALVGEVDDVDVLPSLNLVYAATDRMNLRAAYGRTLARPSFRELAPYATFELRSARTFVGNPALERSLIDNVDVRWEWFTSAGEILAASAYAKLFHDPIELTTNTEATTNLEVQPRNLADARVYGVEVEARRRLGFLPGPLANLTLGGNLTLVESRVDIRDEERVLRLDPTEDTRPLEGQSPFVLNLDLGYESAGTSVGVFYNVYGDRLYAVALDRTPDLYERSRGVLDVTARQALGRGFALSLSARNLLDSAYRISQAFGGTEYVVESYGLGRSFSVGLSYGF